MCVHKLLKHPSVLQLIPDVMCMGLETSLSPDLLGLDVMVTNSELKS